MVRWWALALVTCAATMCVASCTALTDLSSLSPPSGADASVDSGGNDDSTSASDARGDALGDGGATLLFFDNFDRADSTQIGQSWLTKMTAFEVSSNMLVRVDPDTSVSYVDNVVYRPASEDLLDVGVVVEVHLARLTNSPYPQVHARIQSATAATPAQLDSYLLFPTAGGTTGMSIGRQHGGAQEVIIGGFSVNPPLDTLVPVRFTFLVTGVSPVVLQGQVERQDTVNQSWLVIGSATVQDTDPARITTAGSVGVSGSNGEGTGDYAYDNFAVYGL